MQVKNICSLQYVSAGVLNEIVHIVCFEETPSLPVYVHVQYVKTKLKLWYFYLEAACPKGFQLHL